MCTRKSLSSPRFWFYISYHPLLWSIFMADSSPDSDGRFPVSSLASLAGITAMLIGGVFCLKELVGYDVPIRYMLVPILGGIATLDLVPLLVPALFQKEGKRAMLAASLGLSVSQLNGIEAGICLALIILTYVFGW
jgi:hypothetical protein